MALVKRAREANRLVEVALPATREEEYRLVDVELVVEAFVAKKLVDVAFTSVVEVAKRLVVVAEVNVASVAVKGVPVKLTAPVTVKSPFTVVSDRLVSPEAARVVAETDVPDIEPPEMAVPVMVPPVIAAPESWSIRLVAAIMLTMPPEATGVEPPTAVMLYIWDVNLLSSWLSRVLSSSSVIPPDSATMRWTSTVRCTIGLMTVVGPVAAGLAPLEAMLLTGRAYGAMFTATEPPVVPPLKSASDCGNAIAYTSELMRELTVRANDAAAFGMEVVRAAEAAANVSDGFSAATATCACTFATRFCTPPPVSESYVVRSERAVSFADSPAKCAACGSTSAYVPKVSMKARGSSASGVMVYAGMCAAGSSRF